MQNATLKAVINTDVLNVRTEPNTEAKIWTQIVKDERYPVVAQLDGWVEIDLIPWMKRTEARWIRRLFPPGTTTWRCATR